MPYRLIEERYRPRHTRNFKTERRRNDNNVYYIDELSPRRYKMADRNYRESGKNNRRYYEEQNIYGLNGGVVEVVEYPPQRKYKKERNSKKYSNGVIKYQLHDINRQPLREYQENIGSRIHLPQPPQGSSYVRTVEHVTFQQPIPSENNHIKRKWHLPTPPTGSESEEKFLKRERIEYVKHERENSGEILSVIQQPPLPQKNGYVRATAGKGEFYPTIGHHPQSSQPTYSDIHSLPRSTDSYYSELNFNLPKKPNKSEKGTLTLPSANQSGSYSTSEVVNRSNTQSYITEGVNNQSITTSSSAVGGDISSEFTSEMSTSSPIGAERIKDAYMLPLKVEDKLISDSDESRRKAKESSITGDKDNNHKDVIRRELDRMLDLDISFDKGKTSENQTSLSSSSNVVKSYQTGSMVSSQTKSEQRVEQGLKSGTTMNSTEETNKDVANSLITKIDKESQNLSPGPKRSFRNLINEIITKKEELDTIEKDETDNWEMKSDKEKLQHSKQNEGGSTIKEWMQTAEAVKRRQSDLSGDSSQIEGKSTKANAKSTENKQTLKKGDAKEGNPTISNSDHLLKPIGNSSSTSSEKRVSFQDDEEDALVKSKPIDKDGDDDVFVDNNDLDEEDDSAMRDKWRRLLRNGRRETIAECKQRLFGRTIYAAPTYACFKTGWHADINLDKIDKINDCRNCLITRSFDNSVERPSDAEVMSKEAEGVYDNGGAYVKLFCTFCRVFESDSCCECENDCNGDHTKVKKRKKKTTKKPKKQDKKGNNTNA